jgi:hypothetical protein
VGIINMGINGGENEPSLAGGFKEIESWLTRRSRFEAELM